MFTVFEANQSQTWSMDMTFVNKLVNQNNGAKNDLWFFKILSFVRIQTMKKLCPI